MVIVNHKGTEVLLPYRTCTNPKRDTNIGTWLIGKKAVKVCGGITESNNGVKYDH